MLLPMLDKCARWVRYSHLAVVSVATVATACTGFIESLPAAPQGAPPRTNPGVATGDAGVGSNGDARTSNPDGSTVILGPDGSVLTSVACEQPSVVAEQPLRRLSGEQYENTLRDLFGATLGPQVVAGSIFPATQITTGFANDAEANTVNTTESNRIEDNASRIADLVLANPAQFVTGLMPCGLSSGYTNTDVDNCMAEFVETFGLRAYRRPLTSSEAQTVNGLYQALRAEMDANDAFAGVIQFFVQSPPLLYRVERGAGEIAPGVTRLSDYEMASRLSYFFLNSMPDDALFAAAETGQLSSPEGITREARRLMTSPAFLGALTAFHRDWLQLYHLESDPKDMAEFPTFTPQLRAELQAEIGSYVRRIFVEGDGSFSSLMGTDSFPMTAMLATHYGTTAPSGTSASMTDRRGILTLASVMAAQANADRTNPIHRGVFIQREILCNTLPLLPGDIDTQTALQSTATLPTARERLSPLLDVANNPACAGCHVMFNPTGLAFENYDGIGRWRDTENGVNIDSTASVSVDGENHAIAGPIDFAQILAQSDQVEGCYARQWYRAALGRTESAEDRCGMAAASAALQASGGDIREMLVALTQTYGFMYRSSAE